MQKWEYLAIVGISTYDSKFRHSGTPRINRFTEDGIKIEDISTALIGQTIAQLGNDGWELVGVEGVIFFFKRPKSQPEQ